MINFNKPVRGAENWGDTINGNWDFINKEFDDVRSQIQEILNQINNEVVNKVVFVGYMHDYQIIGNNDTYFYKDGDDREFERVMTDIPDNSVFLITQNINNPNVPSAIWFSQGDLILKSINEFSLIGENIGFYYVPDTIHEYNVQTKEEDTQATIELKTTTSWKKEFGLGKSEIPAKDASAEITIVAPQIENTLTTEVGSIKLSYQSPYFYTPNMVGDTKINIVDVSFFYQKDLHSQSEKIEVAYSTYEAQQGFSTIVCFEPKPDDLTFNTLAQNGKIFCMANYSRTSSSTTFGHVTLQTVN